MPNGLHHPCVPSQPPWDLTVYRFKLALLMDGAHNARTETKGRSENKCSCGRKRLPSAHQNTLPPRTFATAVNVFLIFSRPTKPLIVFQLNSQLISKNLFHKAVIMASRWRIVCFSYAFTWSISSFSTFVTFKTYEKYLPVLPIHELKDVNWICAASIKTVNEKPTLWGQVWLGLTVYCVREQWLLRKSTIFCWNAKKLQSRTEVVKRIKCMVNRKKGKT